MVFTRPMDATTLHWITISQETARTSHRHSHHQLQAAIILRILNALALLHHHLIIIMVTMMMGQLIAAPPDMVAAAEEVHLLITMAGTEVLEVAAVDGVDRQDSVWGALSI